MGIIFLLKCFLPFKNLIDLFVRGKVITSDVELAKFQQICENNGWDHFCCQGAPRSLPQSESILLEGVPVPIGNLLSQYLKQESQTELWGFYKFTKKCEESGMNHTKFVYWEKIMQEYLWSDLRLVQIPNLFL